MPLIPSKHHHHGGYHHQPSKKDDSLGLAPLLLTLPLLLGLGALLFAATNGSNTVVNVNVNTTQVGEKKTKLYFLTVTSKRHFF